MRWIYKLPLRLRSIFSRNKADQDLSSELQFHLQNQIEENIALGMPAEDARYAALRKLGGLEQVKEQCRETRRVSLVEHAIQDLRFAWRNAVKKPGFALVVVATLALGIGVNTAIFSLINGILLRPLPYAEPDRLVIVSNISNPKGAFVEFGQRLRTMDLAAFTTDTGFNLSGNGEAIRLNGSGLSANLLPMLGVKPELGRLFSAGDDVPGKSRLVILSHSLWQTKFGGNPNVIGSSVTLDDIPREVVGVMTPQFRFPSPESQLWIPVEINTGDRNSMWGPFLYTLMGRLHPGVELASARADFKAAVPQAIKAYPWPMGDRYGSWAEIVPLQQESVGGIRTMLLVLFGAVVLVLFVACANVANLLLARSAARQREMAVRAALGASRRRIIAQLLTESVFLAVGGGTCGCFLAYLTLGALKALLPVNPPGIAAVAMDGRVLLFSVALSLVTGLIFGMAPAWKASKIELDQSLKSNALSSGTSKQRSRLSSGLVVCEIALAVVLVSGAALLVKSLWTLAQLNIGFRPDHLITAQITPTVGFCNQHAACVDFYRELLDQLRAVPGIKNAAVSDSIPLTGLPATVLAVEDHPEFSTNSPVQAWEFMVSPSYLSTMEIPLLRGRNFTDTDGPNAPPVVMVSKSMAQSFWPGQDPIGKRVKPSWQPRWRTVVAVVDDVAKYKALQGQEAMTWAASLAGDVYFPAAQGIVAQPMHAAVILRSDGSSNPAVLQRQITALVASIGPAIPVSKMRTMDEVLSDSVATPRAIMWLFLSFAGLALALGVIGIYSVMSYSVAQRTREIGIRMAMGAGRWHVLRMVLRQGALMAASGVAVGVVCGVGLTRFMRSLLYGVRPTDPFTFAIVAIAVTVAAILATYVPSRRATTVDPTVALKYE